MTAGNGSHRVIAKNQQKPKKAGNLGSIDASNHEKASREKNQTYLIIAGSSGANGLLRHIASMRD